MKLLRDAFAAEGKDPGTLVVACRACEMTMWARSDNALTDGEHIFCRSCGIEDPQPPGMRMVCANTLSFVPHLRCPDCGGWLDDRDECLEDCRRFPVQSFED